MQHLLDYSTKTTVTAESLVEEVVPVALTPLYDCVAIYRRFPAYQRVISLATMIDRDLPVLQGYVTHTINEEVYAFLKGWMSENEMERLTAMFDSSHHADYIPPSQHPTLEEVPHLNKWLQGAQVAILMEENDPYQQSYSVLTAFGEDHLTLEVVGPGFEASDLTRGHIIPHEIITIKRKGPFDDLYRDLVPADIQQRRIISRDAYLHSMELRYRRVYNLEHGRAGLELPADELTMQQHHEVEHLLECHLSPLLRHKSEYTPISFSKLYELYSYLSELDSFYPEEVRDKVVSASFLRRQGLVFWGIYSGRRQEKRSA